MPETTVKPQEAAPVERRVRPRDPRDSDLPWRPGQPPKDGRKYCARGRIDGFTYWDSICWWNGSGFVEHNQFLGGERRLCNDITDWKPIAAEEHRDSPSALPCPNGCPSSLYHSGFQVWCNHCGLRGPEQSTGGADEATRLWNALPRPNAELSRAGTDLKQNPDA